MDKEQAGVYGITPEHLLLLLFISVSSYMYIGAKDFSSSAALFPQLTAMVIIVGCALLLIKDVLSAYGVALSEENAQQKLLPTEDEEDKEHMRDTGKSDGEELKFRNAHLVMGLLVFYIAASYLIGMLWATPMFVFLYSIIFDNSMKITIGLTLLTFMIAYAFMSLLILPIDEGVLWEL